MPHLGSVTTVFPGLRFTREEVKLSSETMASKDGPKKSKIGLFLVLPAQIVLLFVVVFPMLSSIYLSLTKKGKVAVGLERLSEVRKVTSLPLVGIGGITRENAREVIAAGADAVAVIRGILDSASPEEATRQLIGSLGET